MKTSEPRKPKKPYKPPVLERYGDVRKITKAVGLTGKNVKGSGNQSMTGV